MGIEGQQLRSPPQLPLPSDPEGPKSTKCYTVMGHENFPFAGRLFTRDIKSPDRVWSWSPYHRKDFLWTRSGSEVIFDLNIPSHNTISSAMKIPPSRSPAKLFVLVPRSFRVSMFETLSGYRGSIDAQIGIKWNAMGIKWNACKKSLWSIGFLFDCQKKLARLAHAGTQQQLRVFLLSQIIWDACRAAPLTLGLAQPKKSRLTIQPKQTSLSGTFKQPPFLTAVTKRRFHRGPRKLSLTVNREFYNRTVSHIF